MEPLSEFIVGACEAAMLDLGFEPEVSPLFQIGNDIPSIVYQQVSDVTIESLDGRASDGKRFQLDLRTMYYADLEELDAAVLTAMRSRGRNRVLSIESASDLIEDDISEDRVYRRLRAVLLE